MVVVDVVVDVVVALAEEDHSGHGHGHGHGHDPLRLSRDYGVNSPLGGRGCHSCVLCPWS
jgi:hypothetical protein